MSTQKKIQGVESIAVKEFFGDYGDQLKLRLVTSDKTLSRSTIREKSINRPALAEQVISNILLTKESSFLNR